TDRSRAAGVPSVEVCMGCHAQFPPQYDELEGIRILKQHWAEQRPIEWEQIHRLPEYVKFRHNRHVAAGVTCQKCHGPVEKLDKLYLVPDPQWWPRALPTAKLEMGWCIMCHRENDQQASQDCLMCHY
ncbi:MAG: cytochrome c3 family protein, partial [Proteobacteria bacterium]|nr:cytochrome c3 family protein [Pseudomonadota bacterium]